MRKLWFHLQTADSNEQVQRSLKPERSSQIMTHAPLQAQELMRQDRVEQFFGLQVETQGVITGENISVLVACSVHNLPTFDWHQVKERRKSDEGSNINQRKSPQVKNLQEISLASIYSRSAGRSLKSLLMFHLERGSHALNATRSSETRQSLTGPPPFSNFNQQK